MPYQLQQREAVHLLELLSIAARSSGADEQLISRSVGTSLAVKPSGLLSSMLITVGTPAENVMPCCCTHSKKRLCENRLAMCIVMPFCRNGMRLTICGEFQPNERYSRMRSSSVRPRIFQRVEAVHPEDGVVQTMIFGRAVVPEVQTMPAMSIGVVALGELRGVAARQRAKDSSCGSFAPPATSCRSACAAPARRRPFAPRRSPCDRRSAPGRASRSAAPSASRSSRG